MFNKYTASACVLICCWLAESIASSNSNAVSINFGSSYYQVNESDGYLEISLVASPKPKSKFYVKLDVLLNPRKRNGSLASKKDVDTSTVRINFKRKQQIAFGRIKIFNDDMVEGLESFAVKMSLPSNRGVLKYGHPTQVLVDIRDTTAPSPLMVQLSASDYHVQESSGELCMGVEANSASTEPFSVYAMPMTNEPKSATSGDFNSSVSEIKFSVGQYKASVCIPIHDDNLKEGNETFGVLLSIPDNTLVIPGPHVMASVVILDDANDNRSIAMLTTKPVTKETVADKIKRCGCKPRTPIEVQFSAADYVVQESSGEVCLVVVANDTSSVPFSVYVMPLIQHPLSASGGDFKSSVIEVQFTAGQSNASVCIPIHDDCLKEGNETFSVFLGVPNNTAGVIPGKQVLSNVTIIDDARGAGSSCPKESIADKIQRCGCKQRPPLEVQFSAGDYAVQESSGEVCLVVVANDTSSVPFSVYVMPLANYPISATATSRDFNSSVIEVRFSVGQSSAPVCIPIHDDCLKEGNETFSALLIVPNNNNTLIPGDQLLASVTILDDANDINSTGKSCIADIIRKCGCKPLPEPTPTPSPSVATMSLAPSSLPSPSVTVVSSSAVTANVPTATAVPTASVTPSPTSSPVVCIGFGSPSVSVNESDEFVTINLIKDGRSADNITVFITVMLQEQVQAGPSTQPPAISVSSLMVNLPALFDGVIPIRIELSDDSVVEQVEFYELTLQLSDADGSSVKLGEINTTHIIVNDDDKSVIVEFSSTEYSGDEADGLIPVTVVATGTSSIPYTVIITPSESDPRSAREGIDYSNEAVEVTFNPGEIEKIVNVIINPDCLREGSEFFNISLSLSPAASTLGVCLGDPIESVIEIEDTDIIYVNFSQALYSAQEGDGVMNITLEADGFSIWPFTTIVIPMEVGGSDGASDDGVYFSSGPLIAEFTPGASQASISLNIMRDELFEETEMLKLVLAVPDKFSNIDGMLLIRTGDNEMADGEIINSRPV